MLQKNQRIEFFNSLFSDTWCIFEKINAQRLVYLYLFNLACTLSDVFYVDTYKKEIEDMKQAMMKQK